MFGVLKKHGNGCLGRCVARGRVGAHVHTRTHFFISRSGSPLLRYCSKGWLVGGGGHTHTHTHPPPPTPLFLHSIISVDGKQIRIPGVSRMAEREKVRGCGRESFRCLFPRKNCNKLLKKQCFQNDDTDFVLCDYCTLCTEGVCES